MRYAFIAKQRTHYPLRTLCRVMEVSVSGFHAHTLRQQRPDGDAAVRARLRQAHVQSRGTYGRERLRRVLRADAMVINHKRVARLMREEGLRGKSKGRFRPVFSTGPGGHRRHVADNGLDRRFDVESAPQAWVGDITSVPTRQGWLYLATVIDLRTRRVMGYSTSDRMQEELVVNALRNAPVLVMLSMKDRKVYVGWLEWVPPLRADTSPYIKIVPAWSGYRDAQTMRIVTTEQYEEALFHNPDAPRGKILAIGDISNASLYDPDVYASFLSTTPPSDQSVTQP